MKRLTVVKWGNGYGMRLPMALLAQLGARDSDVFEVEASPGSLVLRRLRRGATPLSGSGGELRPPDLQALSRGLQKIMSEADRLSILLEGKVGE